MKQASFSAKKKKNEEAKVYCQKTCTCVHMTGADTTGASTLTNATAEKSTVRQRGMLTATYG